MQVRQTEEIGGRDGEAFEARREGHSISCLTSYSIENRLSGFKVQFNDDVVVSVGNTGTNARQRLESLDSDSVKTIQVYTNSEETKVLGLRLTQQSNATTLHGKQTEDFRTVSVPGDTRFLGISGQTGQDCIVSIKFTYESARAAMQGPNSMPRGNGEQTNGTQNSTRHTSSQDESIPRGRTQETNYGVEIAKNGLWIVGGTVLIGGLGMIARYAWNRRSNDKEKNPESGSDDEEDSCRNPYN